MSICHRDTEAQSLKKNFQDGIPAVFLCGSVVKASVEIDPRRLTREHIVALREIGFNRASLGVQDFDPKVQEAIRRIQPRDLKIKNPPQSFGSRRLKEKLSYIPGVVAG